ncbi:MAG TPA: helix-turn-helix domain-containing protein [Steroidobacteraceae bacterium]|nr:helix-turn-helix domain-containing protein [Steroidobacteraceae bacterium]
MDQVMVLGLMRGVYWFDDALQDALASKGVRLTRAESFVIINLMLGERRAINIARKLGVSRQAISQILRGLEARGYVTITQDPTDPRARIASYSATFDPHAQMCAKIIRASERELARRIGKQAFAGLREALAADWGPSPKAAETSRSMRRQPQAAVRAGDRRARARPSWRSGEYRRQRPGSVS